MGTHVVLQVGRLVRAELDQQPRDEVKVMPDGGQSYMDYGDDSSDSGLEDVV